MVENATPASEKPATDSSDRHFITKTALRRFMKSEGCDLVSEEVMPLLIAKLEDQASIICKKAIKIAQDSKVKRISADIIKEAMK